jgi:Protein of unknown function (DUF3102)
MDGDLFLPSADAAIFRAEHAEAIRVLGQRIVGDIIEIGQRLIAVRETCEHGEWLSWLDQEFRWSDRTARRFIDVVEAFGSKLDTVSDLPINAGALYFLAGPTVPPAARGSGRARRGERITKDAADKLIREKTKEAIVAALKEWEEQRQPAIDKALAEATE